MAAVGKKTQADAPADKTSTAVDPKADISWSEAKAPSTELANYSSDFPDPGNRYYLLDNPNDGPSNDNLNVANVTIDVTFA